jgi:hypothetical protein
MAREIKARRTVRMPHGGNPWDGLIVTNEDGDYSESERKANELTREAVQRLTPDFVKSYLDGATSIFEPIFEKYDALRITATLSESSTHGRYNAIYELPPGGSVSVTLVAHSGLAKGRLHNDTSAFLIFHGNDDFLRGDHPLVEDIKGGLSKLEMSLKGDSITDTNQPVYKLN